MHLVRLAFEHPEEAPDPPEPPAVPLDEAAELLGRQVGHRHVDRNPPARPLRDQLGQLVLGAGRGPGGDGAVGDRLRAVGEDPVEVEVDHAAEPLAGRAGAERAVVAEQPGVGVAVVGPAAAAPPLPEEVERLAARLGDDPAPAQPLGERRLDRVEPPRRRLRTAHEAVDHHGDSRARGVRRDRPRLDPGRRAVDPDPAEAVLAQGLGQPLQVGVGPEVERERDEVAGPLGQLLDRPDDRGRAARLDDAAADQAGDDPEPRIKEGEVVMDLGDAGHRAPPRPPAAGPLRHGDGGGDAVDPVGVGLVEPLQELPGVGRERLDVPPLPFRIEGVERERALARPAHPRERHELVERDVEVDPLQVVDPDPPQLDRRPALAVVRHRPDRPRFFGGSYPGSPARRNRGRRPGPAQGRRFGNPSTIGRPSRRPSCSRNRGRFL